MTGAKARFQDLRRASRNLPRFEIEGGITMFRVAHSRIEFLEPWERFAPGEANAFLLELERELSHGHPLHGAKLVPLGHSGAADDALFEMGEGRVVQVHLTFSLRAEQPPFPRHRIYSTTDEWVQQVMLPEHEGH